MVRLTSGLSQLGGSAESDEGLRSIRLRALRGAIGGKFQAGDAAGAIGAIFERQRAAVPFGDLAAQHESDAGAPRLGSEERDEEIGGARKARAFVRDPDFEHGAIAPPSGLHAAVGGQRSVGGVAQQVDQHLLELIGIALNGEVRPRNDFHGNARFEARRPQHACGYIERLQLRTRQLGETRVGADEAAEAFGCAM